MVKTSSGKSEVDFEKIKKITKTAIRFLDNVIDAGEYPTVEINMMAKKTRRIGLGVMGFADLLYQLEIPYSSQEGRDLAEKIMSTIDEEGWKASKELAKEKGVFPGWSGSKFEKQGKNVRNCAITAIAPTGSLSMVGDTSGGCEPNFALAFIKNSHSIGEQFTYVNKHFENAAKKKGFYSEELMKKIASQGTLDGIDEVPDDVKKVFEVSFNITAEKHILMQAAFQKYVSNAVSKTINFPNSATLNQVKEGYMLAWKTGCKGCTVYRDGSRGNQVLNIKEVNKNKKKESKDQIVEKTKNEEKSEVTNLSSKQITICPECDTTLIKQEGCVLCPECSWSACSH